MPRAEPMNPVPSTARLRWLGLLCAALSVLGLLISGYLGWIDLALRRGDLFGGPICGDLGALFSCHAVAASRFSRLFGIPLAFWGVVGYLGGLVLSLSARAFQDKKGESFTALAGLALLFLAADAVWLAMMVVKIGALCSLCLISYGVNAGLFLAAWKGSGRPAGKILAGQREAWSSFRPGTGAGIGWIFWGVVLTAAAGAFSVDAVGDFFTRAPDSLRVRMARQVQEAPRLSVDTQGDPAMGPQGAPIEVVQFTDFLCPLCREAARFNAILTAAHRREVRLVMKPFPLEQVCNPKIERTLHPGACRLAEAAECAHEQGKFWAIHDRLFQEDPGNHPTIVELDLPAMGIDPERFKQCMASGRGLEAVRRDVQEAGRLGIVGTPTYVVNGVLIRGALTPAVFEELVRVIRERGEG